MVTIQDIAEKAGVTVRTASRAVAGLTQGKRRDAKERAECVLRVAAELGYQPSNVAKALRNGKTKTIGMVVGGLSNKYFGCLIEAFLDELDKYDYRLLLEVTKWNKAKEHKCLQDLLQHRVDGIIYLVELIDKMLPEYKMMLKQRYPLWTLVTNQYGFGMVRSDFSMAIRQAVEYLYVKGHRDLGMIIPHGHKLEEIEMKTCFEDICSAMGIKCVVYIIIKQYPQIDDILTARHDAWVCSAHNTLNRIIEQFSVIDANYKPDFIGFYDNLSWDMRNDAICGAIIRQIGPMVSKLVEMIIDQIESTEKKAGSKYVFPAEFVKSDNFDKIQFRALPGDYKE